MLQNRECCEAMAAMPAGSVDCVLTDPPYLYLKEERLDRAFDEDRFFGEALRVLKPRGMVVLFGRGTSFYRWNTRLAAAGLEFKEEIVWDKGRASSPYLPLLRQHETVSIYARGGAKIRRVSVAYTESANFDLLQLRRDISAVSRALGRPEALEQISDYLLTGEVPSAPVNERYAFKTAMRAKRFQQSRIVSTVRNLLTGRRESSVIRQALDPRRVHPTQKPVRLLERLIALTTDSGDTVLDPFAGSGSTGVACLRTGREFVGFEIDEIYFCEAVNNLANQMLL